MTDTNVDFRSLSVCLSSTRAIGKPSPLIVTYRKCNGGKPSNLGDRDNKVDDLFGPPYSSIMQNSLKGNEAGMFLQYGKETSDMIFESRNAKIIIHAKKGLQKKRNKLLGKTYNFFMFTLSCKHGLYVIAKMLHHAASAYASKFPKC